jgi:hypothetical protein
MNTSQTALKVRVQLERFLGIFSPHFSKPALTFLGDMLYGLQASKDVKLSCIGRGLDEGILLKKTEERLSRNLRREGLDEGIFRAIAREGAKRIGKDTLVVVDPTDIRKLYARKMPYLATVRDGSKGELGKGYWGCAAIACESGGRRITPLHLRLWSCESPGFISENDEIKAVIDQVSRAAKRRGIYVIDRGGDRDVLFNHLLDNWLRFIIRLVGNRTLLWKNKPFIAEALAAKCRMIHAATIWRETEDGEKCYEIQFGAMNVRLPHRSEPLRLIVVRGFGEKPVLLLTSVPGTDSRQSLWQIVEGFMSRWRVEDAIRFIKQSYQIEDIRLLDYTRLKNMMAIVLAAAFFASTWLGESVRRGILVRNITRISKRLFGVPDFHYYALADGISRLFNRCGKWCRQRVAQASDRTNEMQQELPLFAPG